jgi:hypothetical protein
VETRATRFGLWTWTVLVVLFLYLPIAIIVVYAFNSSNIQSWPISGFTTKWFASTWHNREVREALVLSLKAALVATSIALVLGSAGAFAVSRFRFFGRETISFVFVLPLALPGIITGMALNSYFGFWGWQLSIWTIIVGHATFCGARFRRPARLCPLLRRGDRDNVHGGRSEHPSALDLREDQARPAAPSGQRCGGGDHRAHDHPGLSGSAAFARIGNPSQALNEGGPWSE